MSNTDAINYLFSLQSRGINLDTKNISQLLEEMGNPHAEIKAVLVAGTNGKGSTAAILHSILKRAGYKVGLYTSPHLSRFTERIKVNDREISEERLDELIDKIRVYQQKSTNRGVKDITYFEFATVMAFLYFQEEEIDIAVVEVGMGGRYDATNLLHPLLSIITNISLEHEKYLGDTVIKIAGEKAEIIRNNGIVLTGVKQEEVYDFFKNICTQRESVLYRNGKDFFFKQNGTDDKEYKGIDNYYRNLTLNMIGSYQRDNSALAIAASELLQGMGYKIEYQHIKEGLNSVYWPGRFEVINSTPKIVLDGAHNPEGIKSLKETLETYFPNSSIKFIFGVCNDKDYKSMLNHLIPLSEEIVLVKAQNPRALSTQATYSYTSQYHSRVKEILHPKEAFDYCIKHSDKGDVLCVTGSLFLVGEIRDIIKGGL